MHSALWRFLRFLLLFTAARSNAIHFHDACKIYDWGDLETNLVTWQDSRWLTILARSFLIQIFLHLCKKNPKDNEWMEILQTLKNNFSCNFFSSRYLRKCNRFSIVIVDLQDASWMTDGHRLKWSMKLGKNFVLIYSPSLIKLGIVQLCIFVSLCKLQYSTFYEKFRV